jgi:hypothetical protein
MHKDVDARWSNGCTIEVIVTIELSPCRQFGIEARTAKEVEGEKSLRKEVVP